MELTEIQYQWIADCLPRQRGNVSMTNLRLLNALLYALAQTGGRLGDLKSMRVADYVYNGTAYEAYDL
jgi:hypothetical protein